ncbi:hypothetical protein Q5741_16695 [Paenibacillus sp. JX-17]|uniref:Glycosyltransferase RgtA/B/C/D-like domain-containing protein n=1 Tax=Paenibacillus lacisoli TaxID=3064525 RepID=A0ABT9CKA9_9BACL|nr:hypothetical protein [Paenibacillus sp. JX-17]MDO7908053.1 hypothetical protein [Paenibacillus sp. JX-17]
MNKASAWLQRWLPVLSRYLPPSGLAAVGVLLVTVIALFTRPYIGMADNGDFFRILYSNGLYFNAPDYNSQYLGYFVKDFGILQYFNENGTTLTSSQSLFIKMSIWLNKLLIDSQHFDVRVQAALFTILYIGGVYLLVEGLTSRMTAGKGYIIAFMAVLVFGDTAYTAYFNSFYSESIVWIMMIYLFASGLLLYRRRYNDYVLLGIFAISALLLTTSKQQNAPVGIIIGVMGIGLLWVRNKRGFQVLAAGSLVLIVAAGAASYVLIPKEFVNINKYHAMTRGVLNGAAEPEETLQSLGIDRQYAILSGSIYYEPYTTVDVNSPLLEQRFYNHYGFGSILKYYLTHPGQAGSMLNLAARDAFIIRPAAMGNYEKMAGKPFGEQTRFFSGYSLLKAAMTPKTFGFILIWMIVILGMYTPSFLAELRSKHRRGLIRLPLLLMMIAMGLSGIAVSIIGAGDADLAKHEFMFTAAFDLVTLALVSDLIRGSIWQPEEVDAS